MSIRSFYSCRQLKGKQEVRSQGLEIALEWANGPVFVLPAQKPAGEGRRFESLLHRHDGGSRVTIGWVSLDVALSCRGKKKVLFQTPQKLQV